MVSRLILVCCLFAGGTVLPGCATPPRKLCLSGCVNSASIRAHRMVQSCMERATSRVAYRTVVKRLPLNPLEIEPAQLLNSRRPTAAEAKILSAMQKELRTCTGLTKLEDLHPDPVMARLIRQTERDADGVVDELIARRLSWGEANKRRFVLATELDAELHRESPTAAGASSADLPPPDSPAPVIR